MAYKTAFLLLLAAGLMNGSFVVPTKYIRLPSAVTWLLHSIIGLLVIPWILLIVFIPNFETIYQEINTFNLVFLIICGILFGCGQVGFALAIDKVGIALAFCINISIGLVLGSISVILYSSSLFTSHGIWTILAVLLIMAALFIQYQNAKQTSAIHSRSTLYHYGWLLAIFAGLTSGLQNFAFVFVGTSMPYLEDMQMYGIWPPFLTAAALPMLIGFFHQIKVKEIHSSIIIKSCRTFRTWLLIGIMGLCFTGSLFLYSLSMEQLNHTQKIIGWPSFMVSIILSSQLWGKFFEEPHLSRSNINFYYLLSTTLLVLAIVVLAIAQ